jgi:RluA family pseudouridine synthase
MAANEEEEEMLARPVSFPAISNALLKSKQGPIYALVRYRDIPIRVVAPYVYSFELKYKQPPKNQVWNVRDFYCKELGLEPGTELEPKHALYLRRATETGLVKVNDKPCTIEYVLKPGDVLSRIWHRHEVPVVHVPASEIILKETPDYIVVNKPSTVPFHPGGDYRMNSLTRILENERADLRMNIFPIHRLDRLTSGLLVIARSSQSAVKLAEYIQGRKNKTMRKTYLAKVKGRFPTDEDALKSLQGFTKKEGNWVTISIPISDTFPRMEINEKSKESLSRFCLLEYDPVNNLSLMKCEPVTGRTHQLRIHLLSIGFPIGNDPDYGQMEKLKYQPPQYDEAFHRDCVEAIERLKDLPHPIEAVKAGEEGPIDYRFTFNGDGSELAKKQREEVTDDELKQVQTLAKEICPECSEPLLPPFHFGIWLHSFRVRLFLNDALVDDIKGVMPPWAQGVDTKEGFWED